MLKKILFAVAICFIATSSHASNLEPQYLKYVKELFNKIQARTFKNSREYCGYIGINKLDELVATPPTKGREESCLSVEPPASLELIASYHTHGAFSIDAESEVPSSDDMMADFAEGVDGFIATPGGRIWFIDKRSEIATMECGRNCVIADPNFKGNLLDPVNKSYTLKQIRAREATQ